MSFYHKNNKSPKSSPGTKRYTTRQIMELTEKRRKQMDEEEQAKRLSAAVPQTVTAGPQPQVTVPDVLQPKPQTQTPLQPQAQVQVPIQVPTEIQTGKAKPQEQPASLMDVPREPAAPKGETVAGLFRQDAVTSTEKKLTEFIAREFDKAAQDIGGGQSVVLSGVSLGGNTDVADIPPAEKADDIAFGGPVKTEIKQRIAAEDSPLQKRGMTAENVVLFILEAMFFGLSFILMAAMMFHLLQAGWNKYYYDQSPFIFVMALTMVWLSRKNFVRRTRWFWGSTVIIAGGIGVFMAAAQEGQTYIELASFLIVSFGVFLWRYREECVCRLFFPLLSLLFVFAPPGSWEKVTMAPLNAWVYHVSAWLINSMHIPVHYDGEHLRVAAGSIYFAGDPTTFRSITVAAVLAIACLSFQNMAASWSALLISSVVFWAMLGNILRVTLTGLMLENFGLEYASMFYSDYSVFVVMFIILAGLALTSGLLPHKEDFE